MVDDYAGSASGPPDYTVGVGWSEVSTAAYPEHWVFDSDAGGRDGLVIEARLYSTPSTDETLHTDYFIDWLTVNVNDDAYWIHTPGYSVYVPEPGSLALLGLGALVVLRRR